MYEKYIIPSRMTACFAGLTNVGIDLARDEMCQALIDHYGEGEGTEFPVVILSVGYKHKGSLTWIKKGKYIGLYVGKSNLICMAHRKSLHSYCEYSTKSLRKHNVFRKIKCSNETVKLALLSHEVAHWFQEKIKHDKGKWKKVHGKGFREAYAFLRETFINNRPDVTIIK